MNTTINCIELNQLLAAAKVVLVDVLTPEDFEQVHIAGAKNACVYEMVFLDRVAELAPDKDRALVVYDATGATMSAETARDKLVRAGYSKVSVLAGGLAAWRAADFALEGAAPVGTAAVTARDGEYRIDVEKSSLEWIGRNINNRHYGRIAIAAGELVLCRGCLAEGRIVMDMTSIANLDLEDAFWKDLLLRHLKSDDFFAVERYPVATFNLNGWEPLPDATPGRPNGIVTGTLTIKEVTRPVSFPAVVAPQEDGSIKAHAVLDIDRTLWNVSYGSGRFFERLGMHLVHDLISLELFIVAR